jgi:hypothetical protein
MNLTNTIKKAHTRSELQRLLEQRQSLALDVVKSADQLKSSSDNEAIKFVADKYKSGVEWASYQYQNFLDFCKESSNWAVNHPAIMVGSSLIATGLIIATLPVSGPALAIVGGGAAVNVAAVGSVAIGTSLVGAGTAILMNANSGGNGGETQESNKKPADEKQASPSQEVQKTDANVPKTKSGQVGRYGELKHKSTNDGLDAHHIPNDQWMKAHGVKEKDGIAMLVDRDLHRIIHYGPNGIRSIDVELAPRTALLKSVRRIKNVLQEKGMYSQEWRGTLQEVIRKNVEKFPNLFEK